MLAALLIISVAPFLVELVLLGRALWCVRRERRTVRRPYAPRAAVIAPHYGWDVQAEGNAAKLLRQDYAGDYQVLFITHIDGSGSPDASYRPLQRLCAESPSARVLLARNVVDHALARSQKAENLLTALAAVPDDVEVFAFVDADAGIGEDWLRRLVEPLQEEKIGITTGARFYAPLVPSVAAFAEAVWVNHQIPLYGDPRLGMVWGGSSAIRRTVFQEGSVRRRWEHALFEDQHLTRTMAELRKRIHFVPDCLPVNYTGDRSWRQVLEFTNRQMGVTYWMRLRLSWWLALTHLLPKGLVFVAAIPLTVLSPERYAPLLAVPLLESLSYFLFTRTLPGAIRTDRRIRRTMFLTSLTVPIAMLVGGLNGLMAPFMRSVTWGGVRYTYGEPDGCAIIGRASRRAAEPREWWWEGFVRRARGRLARLLQVEPLFELEDVPKED